MLATPVSRYFPKTLAPVLAAALVATSPGLGAYEAFGQVYRAARTAAPAPVLAPLAVPGGLNAPTLDLSLDAAPALELGIDASLSPELALSLDPNLIPTASALPSFTAAPALERSLAPRAQAVREFSASLSDLSFSAMREGAARLFERAAEAVAPALAANRDGERRRPRAPEAAPPADGSTAREPVAKVLSRLEKTAQADPAAAHELAMRILVSPAADRRAEVRLAAAQTLDRLALEPGVMVETMTGLLRLFPADLRAIVTSAASLRADGLLRFNKADTEFAVRRQAALTLGARADEFAAQREEVVAALDGAYAADPNPSVRMMVKWALEQYGVDAGEDRFEAVQKQAQARAQKDALRAQQEFEARFGSKAPPQQQVKKRNPLNWIFLALAALAMYFMFLAPPQKPADPPAQAPPAVEQVQNGAAQPADTVAAENATTDPKTEMQRMLDEEIRQTQLMQERLQFEKEQAAKMEAARAAASRSSLISTFLWIGIMGALVYFLFILPRKQMMGKGGAGGMLGGMTSMAGKRQAPPDTRFDDIAGIDEQMTEIMEVVDYLKNPGKYARIGARVPKGVLLEGPPGTGKTLLARAFAGETNASFYSLSGSDFVEMFVGVGASRVRDLFKEARENKPSVIFIDEIDAVGKQRGGPKAMGGGNDEREQTINAILAEMDGFAAEAGVVVVAATNQASTLDSALTRPGRFDRAIHVGNPDVHGREAILNIHARPTRLHPEVDLKFVAERTAGVAGAGLANIINEATLLAARRGSEFVTQMDLDQAIDRETIGHRKYMKQDEEDLRWTAWHEAGHVVGAYFAERDEAKRTKAVSDKVTIIPHAVKGMGLAGGFAAPQQRRRSKKQEYLDDMVGILAAKWVEDNMLGDSSHGPSNDLQQANAIARAMVSKFGMGEKTGLLVTPQDENPFGNGPLSEKTKELIDQEVLGILSAQFERAGQIMSREKAAVQALAEALLQKETLLRDDIVAILEAHKAQ